MHNVVSRLALPVVASALLAGALVAAGPATADTAPLRPSQPDAVSAGGYTALDTPARLLDTRTAKNPLKANESRAVPNVTAVDVPANAAAVVVNLTVASPRADGYLSAFPGTTKPSPLVSNLNFTGGAVVANAAVVKIANGTFTLFNGSIGTTDVVVDVTGWFATGGSTDGAFTPVAPTRLIDTRTPPNTAIPAGKTITVAVRGKAGITSAAGAAVLNVTVAKPGAQGYLTLYPGGTAPAASNVNFAKGQTVAGLAAVSLSSGGSVTIRNASAAAVQVTVDVAGWFRGTTARLADNFSFLAPARLFDTRSPKATLTSGQTRAFPVTGRGGVPTTGVKAVVLTVTATNTQAAGYLTVFPGGSRPLASTLNFARGQTVPNLVVVPVSNGTISVYNGSGGTADVLADVAGFVRSSDLTGDVSHYLRSLDAGQSTTAIAQQTGQLGLADAQAAQGSAHVVLLQFGAQTDKAGGNGSGTGTGADQDGVRLSATNERITYPQVVAAVNGYVDGYVEGRGSDDSPVTLVVGTSTAGFAGATYRPQDKASDWWDQVVSPSVDHASGTGVTVVAGTDIEANFDGAIEDVKAWVTTYLQAASNSTYLVNNGAASGCPTTIGSTADCVAVPIEETKPVETQAFSLADLYAVSAGLAPGRIKVLPQIYSSAQAAQWENVDLAAIAAGKPRLQFAGVLSSYAACSTPGSGCSSIDPNAALTAMNAALDARTSTASTVVPAVTDLTIS